MTWGLVMGGGGVVGIAWEAGVVAGLTEGGVDPASAAAIVGTSAGSVVGSQLRAGWTAQQISAWGRGEVEIAVDPETVAGAAGVMENLDLPALIEIFKVWGQKGLDDPTTSARIGQMAAAARTISEDAYVPLMTYAVPDEWPHGDLRITGLSITTGQRVVWTRDSGVPLHLAVAASCSVPGIFPPVTIGDDRYVDGGVWSGSNADVFLADGFDAVVFIGPLAGDEGIGRVASRSYDAELADLRSAGVATLEITPAPPFEGITLMDPNHRVPGHDRGRADGLAASGAVAALLAGERLPAGER